MNKNRRESGEGLAWPLFGTSLVTQKEAEFGGVGAWCVGRGEVGESSRSRDSNPRPHGVAAVVRPPPEGASLKGGVAKWV